MPDGTESHEAERQDIRFAAREQNLIVDLVPGSLNETRLPAAAQHARKDFLFDAQSSLLRSDSLDGYPRQLLRWAPRPEALLDRYVPSDMHCALGLLLRIWSVRRAEAPATGHLSDRADRGHLGA
ncbi:hypothetical protein [Caballeronia temeraria]|uniref:hypothetical protein n=1 Tax=Caballeronia temeraria TaxID=1777137 RepID=UPI0012FD7BF8|nr:hypothetical protein [Caballeronia temeraria]